jgi:probable addiction module antidote protein
MPKNLNYKADLLADLRNDLGYAAEYLSAAYADSQEAFLVALRDVAEAQKGVGRVAELAKVNRENLYRTLSRHGNPTLNTVGSVLDVLGLKVIIVPEECTSATVGSGLSVVGQTVISTEGATYRSAFGIAAANADNLPDDLPIAGFDSSLQWGVIAQAETLKIQNEAASGV